MAYFDTTWYVNFGNGSSTGYYAVAPWAASTTYVCGNVIRQNVTPAVGSERIFVCYSAGTSSPVPPTFTLTRGGLTTTDLSVKWQEVTGIAALCGDLTNTPNWNTVKNQVVSLGQVIQNVAGTLLLLCNVSGTAGNGAEPAWAAYTTAGATTVDSSVTWVTLGPPATYSGGQCPHARISNAAATNWAIIPAYTGAPAGVGPTIFVADNNAETAAAAITIAPYGSLTKPCRILCNLHNGNYPPQDADLTTGAIVTATGGALGLSSSTTNGTAYYRGIQFFQNTASSNIQISSLLAGNVFLSIFELCIFKLIANAVNLSFGSSNNAQCYNEMRNCQLNYLGTGAYIAFWQGQSLVWKNDSSHPLLVGGSAVPAVFISQQVGNGTVNNLLFEGVDMSGLAGTDFVATDGSLRATFGQFTFKNCKLPASFAVSGPGGPGGAPGWWVDFINCDSANTTYNNLRYRYEGKSNTETTVVRSGGASDGVTLQSRKIATSANPQFWDPFEDFSLDIRNPVTNSAVTITVYGACQLVSLPNNGQIWLDIDYQQDPGSPLGSYSSGAKNSVLAAGTAQASDTSDWTSQAAAYQTAHAYGAFTGVIKAGNASPQQLWFMVSHLGTGTSGSSTTIFNRQADGAQVTDNAGANQIVWQAMMRFSMSQTVTPQQIGPIKAFIRAAAAASTFYIDPKPVLNPAVNAVRTEMIDGTMLTETSAPAVSTNPVGQYISSQRGTPY
jgi:hypothetical protein